MTVVSTGEGFPSAPPAGDSVRYQMIEAEPASSPLLELSPKEIIKKSGSRDFPGGPVVKTLCCQ